MPSTTPRQKVSQVELFGKGFIDIILTGDTFDDAYKSAAECCEAESRTFIHPFDDPDVMAGQGTLAVEILNDIDTEPHFLFASVGGGGLLSGVGTYLKNVSPDTKVIAVEPAGAASYFESNKAGHVVTLDKIDKFVDGAAVKKIGEETFRTLELSLMTFSLCLKEKYVHPFLNYITNVRLLLNRLELFLSQRLICTRMKLKGKTWCVW